MDAIKGLSHDAIRQNWDKYKDIVIGTLLHDSLWDSFETKLGICDDDIYYPVLKKFILNQYINNKKRQNIIKENDTTLIFKGLDGEDRMILHKFCDKIGLHHVSKPAPNRKKNKKHLYVYIPNKWLWEFTEPNPYSESSEYYKKKMLKGKKGLVRI